MESVVHRLFFHQWPQKLIALITAILLWIIVNHSILSVKIVPFVPIRVINLPEDKTIQGLLPNGVLSKRATLTLTGTKDVIEQIEPGDLEIVVDISTVPNEGVVQITKKNLISLNPNINLLNHITQVNHPEFIIKMSPLVTEKIPVAIHVVGDPPEGYEFLDYWPMSLTHSVTGPQDLVLNLKNNGLELTLNLNDITTAQLDAIRRAKANSLYGDELAFFIPHLWKRVQIPFLNNSIEFLNDADAKNLQIDFLVKEWHPVKREMPIVVFYPLKYSEKINPSTYPLAETDLIKKQNNVQLLTVPLLARHVSKLFLDSVQDNMEINVVAVPKSERDRLEWSVDLVNWTKLEDSYVALLLSDTKIQHSRTIEREQFLRNRFRRYLDSFVLYISPEHPLFLDASLDNKQILVQIPYAQ
jgi:hypothetical protein